MSTWNGNRFSVYKSDEKQVLGLLEELGNQTNYNTDNKTDKTGNHEGTWQGISKPTLTNEGLAGTVEKHEDDINGIMSHLAENELKIKKTSEIYFISSGGNNISETTVIITENGKRIMIDCGFESDYERFEGQLRTLGINKLDLLILTHQHSDHAGGAVKMIERFLPDKLIWKVIDYTQLPLEDKTDISSVVYSIQDICTRLNIPIELAYDHVIEFSPTESIEILASNFIDYTVYNANSLVLIYKNKYKKVLISGDAAWSTETYLQGKIGLIDIHKLGHHGGNGSNKPEFLFETRAKFCIYNGFYNVNVATVLNTCRFFYGKVIGLDDNDGLVSFIITGNNIIHNNKLHVFTSPWLTKEGDSVNWCFEKSAGVLAKDEIVKAGMSSFYIGSNEFQVTGSKFSWNGADYFASFGNGALIQNSFLVIGADNYLTDIRGEIIKNKTNVFFEGKLYNFDANGICTNFNQ